MSDPNLDVLPSTGRPVRLEPIAPGFWRVILGVCLAALSPLFGFLVGATSDRPDSPEAIDPLYLGLFAGVIIGGLGVALAVLGGFRLWKHYHRRAPEAKAQ